jgi:ABC-type sugar transport system ATPase subunit
VVIASSDDAELCDTCDRILIMRDGKFTAELLGEQATPEVVGAKQLEGTAHDA